MQKRSTVVIEILIVIIGIGSIAYYKFYFAPKHMIPVANQNERVPQLLVDPASYTIVTAKEQSDYAIIDAEFPYFPEASDAFNNKIKDFVFAKISEHKNVAEENWKSRFHGSAQEDNFPEKPETEEDKMPFLMNAELVQANGVYISFVLDYMTYQGGAHGAEEIVSFNYDVKLAKEIHLEDFFNNDPLYLEDISRFVRKDLIAQLTDSEALNDLGLDKNVQAKEIETMQAGIDEGTKPVATNFSTFTFDTDAITFYFQDYQVGPHSIGLPRSIMPKK